MEPAPQGPPAHGQTSRVAVPIPAGTQVTWYISIPKSKWKPGLCAHCGGSIMAGHARLRFCQTHGRVFHVGCIASNSDTFPCISRDGVSEEAYQMVLAEIIKSRRSLGETELTDADHIKTVPINLAVPPASLLHQG